MARRDRTNSLKPPPESILRVRVPHNFFTRSYQVGVMAAMDAGCKKAVTVWHRRAGKDKTWLNITIKKMIRRVGTYFHVLPELNQGRKILWDGMDDQGTPFLNHFPRELVASRNESEMQIQLRNGSIWQVVGSDRIDSLIGTNPIGIVMSEYAVQNPLAWNLFRPIIAANGGWVGFCYTPRGKNHGWDIYRIAKEDSSWFCQMLTVRDTKRDARDESGTLLEFETDAPVVSEEQIEQDRRDGMPEELIQQEYYCSFEGAMTGSFYGELVRKAYEEGRVRATPISTYVPVDTGWDIGIDDETVIGFTQTEGATPTVIDCVHGSGKGLDHYAMALQRKTYLYGTHYWPHDAAVREWSTGKTRLQTAHNLGFRQGSLGPIVVVPKIPPADGINAARLFIAKAIFNDTPEVRMLLDALTNYHRDWDPFLRSWGQKPVHDWSSHWADMMRYRAVAFYQEQTGVLPNQAITWFNPLEDRREAKEYERDFDPWQTPTYEERGLYR